MLCQTCSDIPLDLFLPKLGSGRRFRNGQAWKEAIIFREGPSRLSEMRASADEGCPMCKIMLAALDNAEPLWAVNEFTSKGHNMLLRRGQQYRHPQDRDKEAGKEWITLRVLNEGEMVISDGQRKGGLYWELKSLGYGQKLDLISTVADSDDSFDMASLWLTRCICEHDACMNERDDTFLPSRLIEVDESGDHLQARLVSTGDWSEAEHKASYFALSYCWGTDRGKTISKATRDTLVQLHDAIDVAMLPKTFRDAMQVVTRLNYRYIWIDALCIVQDDLDDFHQECAMMGRIYANSLCTIAAASSPDGDGGCFLPRDPTTTQPCSFTVRNKHIPYHPDSIMDIVFCRRDDDPEEAEVTIYPNFGPWIKAVERGPVFRRGWCLQERELSPRILHFTQNRLMWECRVCTASEDKREMVEKADKAKKQAAHLSSVRVMDDKALHTVSGTQNRLLTQMPKWDVLAEAFSRRRLSVQTDKLLAISGLAASLAKVRSDDYLAGIWRSNILKGVCWIPVRSSPSPKVPPGDWPLETTDPGIPSWSWAGHDGEIKFCGNDWFSSSWVTTVDEDGEEKYVKKPLEIEVVDASVQLASDGDTFGRVDGGELVFSGWQAQVDISEGDVKEEGEVSSRLLRKEYSLPELNVTVYFDNDPETLPMATSSVRLLQLGTGKNMRGGSTSTENGLVLVPSKRKRGSYRRVGLFDVEGDKEMWYGSRGKGRISIV